MASGFNDIDPERCAHYARFASHLDRRSFDFIYWFLFGLVIFMLFLASWKYSGDLDKIQKLGLEPGSRAHQNKMKKCMLICSIYAVVSVVAVVMEVFALMALQFCDGEDLMPLYWSTWTMMQVGSVIAIMGIMLAMFNSLRGSKNPPWALALGTPVLVVAGIGHAVHGAVHRRVKHVRSMSRGRKGRGAFGSASSSNARLDVTTGQDLPMSRELTLRADESERDDPEIAAKFVGFTPDGAPILKFTDADAVNTSKFDPEHSVIVSRGDGHVVIAFKRPMASAFVQDGGAANGGSGNGSNGSNGDYFSRPRVRSSGTTMVSPGTAAAAAAGTSAPATGAPGGTSGGLSRSPVVRIATPPPTAFGTEKEITL
ncbi:hypothetical protein B0J18DRAFT_254295 [Chaetomium sp. MPI-SDFR-AT-0129]|nr:hypothetical protein B0J18DRAFT_254295 [Chaetomium sp. MPI-SDFR-AT-0129]